MVNALRISLAIVLSTMIILFIFASVIALAPERPSKEINGETTPLASTKEQP